MFADTNDKTCSEKNCSVDILIILLNNSKNADFVYIVLIGIKSTKWNCLSNWNIKKLKGYRKM